MFEIIFKLLDDPVFKAKVKYKTKAYAANEKILEEGKMHHHMHLIKEGKVRIIVHGDLKTKSSVSAGIADLGPSDVFGEFGLFDDSPASADVIAVTDCELIEIDILTFREYLEIDTQTGYKILLDLMKLLIQRLRRADKTIINLYVWGMKAHKIDQHLD